MPPSSNSRVPTRADILARRAEIDTRLTEIRNLHIQAASARGESHLTPEISREIEDLAEERKQAELALARLNDPFAGDAQGRSQGGTNGRLAYDQVHRVGSEERIYAPHKERGFDQRTGQLRASAKPGGDFARDVAAAFLGDFRAQDRLMRHEQEEQVERGARVLNTRAAGTGAFAGLTVPQYLTDYYVPYARAGRPFADACNHHDLPESGMSVNISRITTGTSVALQATENTAVSNTDIDDTLLTAPVQTAAGQQTLSRQALERGTGVEETVTQDLFRAWGTNIDATLLTQATTGLTNVAGAITYTDASPTVAEFYPYFAAGAAAAEAVFLGAGQIDVAVMNPRRWWWLQNAMGSTWPLMGQPGIPAQNVGMNYGEAYGTGFRGRLPNGMQVITDANVPTNLGAGTNQDELYLVASTECHLWEDPDAPMFIRAEQPAAGSLGVLLVVYSYFGYVFNRFTSGHQKIGGTGLTPPAFTGV